MRQTKTTLSKIELTRADVEDAIRMLILSKAQMSIPPSDASMEFIQQDAGFFDTVIFDTVEIVWDEEITQ